MNNVHQQFKKCGVKVKTEVGGSDGWSSGFLYATSPNNQFNYVFTAKHTFKHSNDDDDVFIEDIGFIEIQCYNQTGFEYYEFISKKEIASKIILLECDLVIILVRKNTKFEIPYIQVSDVVPENCWAWSITKANENRLHPLELKVCDTEENSYIIQNWNSSEYLKGCSGSGIISESKPVLYGFIMRHPTEELQGGFIDAVDITFEQINNKLYNYKLEVLSTIDNKKKRIVRNELVVDINDVTINGVKVDLQLARNKVISDSYDDWFHDPLNFIDLSHEDFLFEYFKESFNKEYKVSEAEIFYLPKKTFTLRKAMVIPYAERVFYAALVEVLGKNIDEALSPYVFSARYNSQKNNGLIISGVEQWKKMQYLLKEYSFKYKYVIEIDILNFYDNIDIELLGKKISAVCLTPNERNASKELVKVLKTFANKSNGIPQNNDVSSLLATFYLNQVDAYMRHHVPAYVRFMDDIRIFCNDKFEARRYLTLIEKELRRLNLSLNGQKTKIINLNPRLKKEKNEIATSYRKPFDLERSKLSRFSNSRNVSYNNEAFHLAIKVLLENVKENPTGDNSNERKLHQAITTIRRCVSKGVNLEEGSDIIQFLEEAGALLKERPWVTPQICTMIGVLDKTYIPNRFWNEAIEIVLDVKYNVYPWQGYHLWLLLAKHKIDDVKLRKYASNYLDSNDETSRPIIAAMMIYMGTIDKDFRRVILRKYNEGFTHGCNFQERIALIVLRAIESSEILFNDSKVKAIHESLNYFKDKDLVYIPGEKDDTEIDLELLQIYSL